MKILEGVTVIDFTQTYSGPFSTMQLADFGAKVIKVERKGTGDPARYWGPFKRNNSGYFASVNRNKLGIEVDTSSAEGIEVIKRLTKNADIIVECFKPGTMERMGLGYEDVIQYNPEIIYASLSGFGQTGPMKKYPAYDNVIQSMSGLMDMTGFPEKEPRKAGPSVSDSFSGLNLALGILMAYYSKLNTGKGQRVEVSMLDTLIGMLESPILFKSLLNEEVTRCGNNDAGTLAPYDVYECSDGYFSAGLAGDSGWDKFANVMSMPELIEDARFETNELRCKNFVDLDLILRGFFIDKTRADLETNFSAVNIPNAPVLSIPEIMNHPQLKARDMLIKINDPGIGEYIGIGNPMRMDRTPPAYEKGAPLLGEDTIKILSEFGFSKEEVENLKIKQII